MSAVGGGFPTFPGGPGAAPGGIPGGGFQPQPGFAQQPGGAPAYQQHAAAEPAFVLHIPADPNWQPIEGGDTLEKDGYYCGKIISEKVKNDDGKLQVIMTVELMDPDVVGKKLSKFMPNPAQTSKDTWWLWRGLIRSIYGTIQHAQQAMDYAPPMFTGAYVYFKSEAYLDDRGTMRTGIGAWTTSDEWKEAQTPGPGGQPRHRWAAKVNSSHNPGVGALPGGSGGLPGLPGSPGGGLPGLPPVGGGLPGMPNAPTVPAGLPMPGAAPMQAAMAPPPPAAVQAAPGSSAPAQAGFGFPPPPANGVPQPTAAGIAGGFPGAPPR